MSGIGRRPTSFACLLGAVGAVVALSGCSGGQQAVALPSSTDSRTPLGSSSAADAKAAELAYRNFVAMLDRADSLPAESRRQQLATLMAEPQLSRVLKRIAVMKKQHLTTYGNVIVHVTSVQLTTNGATVLDCQDTRNAGLINSVTQKKVNRGVKEDSTKALLIKGRDGKWRVSKSITLGEGC
ncbi:hypothetical protein F8568_020740 [Actinomadura sp. LD22]|uniref:Nuclear transport factor 2 family protein n=1 Tax=Actinomadura physcomitrii TaxID=2650748 RepID=A0A6I4M994_9ACTN|nr:hypothetical protein [Actinomadura physcomitrii]MWA02758.1 hypothetical protein [Actinomadura physcomitrii]